MMRRASKYIYRQHPTMAGFVKESRLSETDHLNRTILHIAATNGASMREIKHLIARMPSALTQQDHQGRTPLHQALHYHPLKQVQAFISLFTNETTQHGRASLTILDNTGLSPLNSIMINRQINIEVVKLLALPEVLQMIDYLGRTPLHFALECVDTRPDVINIFIERYPQALQIQDMLQKTPLQTYTTNQNLPFQGISSKQEKLASSKTLNLLATAFPDALSITDIDNNTPLMNAIIQNDFPTVQLLAERDPRTVNRRRTSLVQLGPSFWDFPLMYALETMGDWQIIECLLNLTEDDILNTTLDGRLLTPLHTLVMHTVENAGDINNELFLVECFADRSPAALTEVDHMGQTPLHYAVACMEYDLGNSAHQNRRINAENGHIFVEIVRCLCERMKPVHGSDTDALLMKDNQGNTALHSAVSNTNICEYMYTIISSLAEKELRAIKMQNHTGKTPIDIARDLGNQHVVDILEAYL